MKNRECAIVQDLLILYEDGVLQDESKEMIEEHIKECETCRRIYEASKSQIIIDKNVSEKIMNEQDNEMVKAMKKFVRSVTARHMMIIGILLVVILGAEGICQSFTVHGGGIIAMIKSMPVEDVNVKEMYQLESGDIYIVFQSEEQFSLKYMSNMKVPHGEMQGDSENGFYNIHFEKVTKIDNLLETIGYYEVGIVFPIEDYYRDEEETYTRKCSQINYVENFANEKKLLWEKGQNIEKASLELEEKITTAYIENGYLGKVWEDFDEYLSEDFFVGTYAPMIVYEKWEP